ncbi:MAG: GIY-YIG nuclease family protein [Bacilli bacterium]
MGIFNFGPNKKELENQIANLSNEKYSLEQSIESLNTQNAKLTDNLYMVQMKNDNLRNQLESLKLSVEEMKYIDLKESINELSTKRQDITNDIAFKRANVKNIESSLDARSNEYNDLEIQYNDMLSKIDNLPKKKAKLNEAFKAVEYALNEYTSKYSDSLKITQDNIDILNELAPSVTLKLHSMDTKDLKKNFKNNQELIEETLHKYQSKYSTKANIAIYQLMVIALKAELQNVLYNLQYGTLDESLESIKSITKKYISIASDGNQSIASTIIKFITEIEYLFLNAVKIEYQYYLKKEQQKTEQAAIREQMKQDAAEKKELERQKKQIELEESKYKGEIEKIKSQLLSSNDDTKKSQLELKIKELEDQLLAVEDKKEEIVSRQNGKAGNVYVISNLGSFGKNIFKVGMTRRLDPYERIKELGSASVPFTFDIHSFIFSDDAVNLEQKLHSVLDENRVNKINLRKEFFEISIDKLEELVYEIDPSAEFNKTMLAEEYNQSLSLIKDAI